MLTSYVHVLYHCYYVWRHGELCPEREAILVSADVRKLMKECDTLNDERSEETKRDGCSHVYYTVSNHTIQLI